MWKNFDDLTIIPNSFKIAGNKLITVIILDNIKDGSNYGEFNDAKSLIKIANRVKIEDEWIAVSKEDMARTYLHEYNHVMQFYSTGEYDETQAQIYSNFMYEYLHTKE